MIRGYEQKRSVFVISAPASRTQIDPSPAPCSLGLPPPSPPYPPSPSTKTKTYVKIDNPIDKGLNSVGLWHRS